MQAARGEFKIVYQQPTHRALKDRPRNRYQKPISTVQGSEKNSSLQRPSTTRWEIYETNVSCDRRDTVDLAGAGSGQKYRARPRRVRGWFGLESGGGHPGARRLFGARRTG